MAHYEEHCRDCERLLGNRRNDVNRWIDELFETFGPRHRRGRHHLEGAEAAEKLFGAGGKQAALIHILKDCGHIPMQSDYDNGVVDVLGFNLNSTFNGYWGPGEFDRAARQLLATLL